ncbi:MAG: acyl-CoA dehydrogenase family protein, partial [Solirubrobacterales bacterium]
MNFAFDEDQEEFRSTLRRFFEQVSPLSSTRELMSEPLAFSPEVWRQASDQVGLPGLIVSEEDGGQGLSFLELVIAAEELGRVVSGIPFLSTTSAILAIQAAGSSEQRAQLLPALASGEKTAALATAEPGEGWGADGIQVTASGDGDEVVLNGRKSYVVDGGSADLIVVSARRKGTKGADGIVLAVVEADAAGVSRR